MVPQSLMRHRDSSPSRQRKDRSVSKASTCGLINWRTPPSSPRLLQELAQQVQALSLAEQEPQKRMQLALIVGWIGIALGVGAAILALVK